MSDRAQWLVDFDASSTSSDVDGLVPVKGYRPDGRQPEEVAMMERAAAYQAHAVFFEAGRNGGPPVAQAFIFVSDGPADDPQFAELHQRLWSWGGVPLVYRRTHGLVQLFRCAHKPDFVSATGERVCKPYKILRTAAAISADPWWDAARLRNGSLWDNPAVCKMMLSAGKSAHKRLIDAVKQLNADLNEEGILKKHLRRKLLILSLLIAYLEERGVLLPDYFGQFQRGATKFFEILARGDALVKLLSALEERFNGNVFTLDSADRQSLKGNSQLARFAGLIEGREELNGQLTLWQLYSFKDLPVELISHIYQLFVNDTNSSVYTPPFLVRLMLDEALSWQRLDRLQEKNEIILDPACGSGVFLVEAYKRLVLHWRSRNGWKRPGVSVLKGLLKKVHGVDLEEGAVELAAFSLCLALCDALEPETIRASIRLFPLLAGKTLHHSCFFQAKEEGLIKESIGLVTGNPPFTSTLGTLAAERSYQRYESTHGSLPDKQLAYLFLHEAMEMVASGGALSMLQQYNLLYNQQSLGFRRDFIGKWDVREILDFVSVRGLFQKGGADTKVIVVLSEASKPPADRRILHATFRRSGRIDAEQGFDIDYYDLHWLPRRLVLENDGVWRSDLLGGGRVLGFVDRLRQYRTLEQFAESRGWDYGEGYIAGGQNISRPADHIVGKPLLPSDALTLEGIDVAAIMKAPKQPIEGPRSEKRFTPPLLLVRENMNLPHAVWEKHYLTFKAQLVGFAAPHEDLQRVRNAGAWLSDMKRPLQAYVAAISTSLFSRRATAVCADEILALPYPESASLDLSANEQILVDDITDYYRDLIRLGEDSQAMKETGLTALGAFAAIFTRQINSIYKQKPLRAIKAHAWPGAICQPFVFGDGKADWSGAHELQGKLNALLHEQRGTALHITRIARIYDGAFIFLLKPEPLRYWLRSTALRDADETLSDLRAQGF
ncbi:MAG TPA: N-6 DNA methylase [Terriglobales bacterium]|nr:N-6 DNA methylase [Terriglobales bacterium]